MGMFWLELQESFPKMLVSVAAESVKLADGVSLCWKNDVGMIVKIYDSFRRRSKEYFAVREMNNKSASPATIFRLHRKKTHERRKVLCLCCIFVALFSPMASCRIKETTNLCVTRNLSRGVRK
jgi:hypothetical protein